MPAEPPPPWPPPPIPGAATITTTMTTTARASIRRSSAGICIRGSLSARLLSSAALPSQARAGALWPPTRKKREHSDTQGKQLRRAPGSQGGPVPAEMPRSRLVFPPLVLPPSRRPFLHTPSDAECCASCCRWWRTCCRRRGPETWTAAAEMMPAGADASPGAGSPQAADMCQRASQHREG